jgi:hypothetical protein
MLDDARSKRVVRAGFDERFLLCEQSSESRRRFFQHGFLQNAPECGFYFMSGVFTRRRQEFPFHQIGVAQRRE